MKDTVIKGVLWLGGANAFSQAVTWVFTILVARMLDPTDYGLIAMAAVFIGIAEYLNEFGIGAAVVQKKDLDGAEVKALYTASLVLGFAFTGVGFLAAHGMAYFFGEARLVAVIYVLAPTFIISAAKHVQYNLMVRRMEFRRIARIETAARIFTSFATYLCAVAGLGYWTLVAGYLLYNLAQALMCMACERQRPGMPAHIRKAAPALRFGMQVMLARVIGVLSARSDAFVIGKLVGAQQLGVYSFAMSLANKPIDKVISIFNQVLFPVLSREQHDTAKVRGYFLKALEVELLIMLPIFAVIALSADSFVPVILGEKWRGIIIPLKVFSVVGVFQYLTSVTSMLVVAIGRPWMQAYFNTASFAVMTLSMLALGIPYGFDGILLAWAVFYPVLSVVFFWAAARSIGIGFGELFSRVRAPVLMVAVMAAVLAVYSRVFVLNGWRQPVAMVSIGTVTYVLAIMVFDGSKLREIIGVVRARMPQKAA